MWALGCVLYETATLRHAFDANNMCALVMSILRANYPPLDRKRYSAGLRALVDSMLRLDPGERPSMTQLIQTPIVQVGGWAMGGKASGPP